MAAELGKFSQLWRSKEESDSASTCLSSASWQYGTQVPQNCRNLPSGHLANKAIYSLAVSGRGQRYAPMRNLRRRHEHSLIPTRHSFS